MNEEQRDAEYRRIADSIIDKANEHIEGNDPIFVSNALLFGVARFCAFTIAGQAENLQQFNEELQPARDYYLGEFQRMLEENLEDYRTAFNEPVKYGHLMKDVE